MAFTSISNNSSSLFDVSKNNLNFTEKSSEELNDLIKSLNILNPEELSQQDLSNILQRIDSYNGLFTTQQLENIDYKSFKNHVFFDSAVNKVTASFDRIQNIPYDKDELENIKYSNKTDGYTQYLLKNYFPKSKGFVDFKGSDFIVVFDEQGKILNDSKEKNTGTLNPLKSRFSFDFWINPKSSGFTDNQIVFSKIQYESSAIKNGFICFLSGTSSNCYINLKLYVDQKTFSSKTLIKTDEWQNIALNVNTNKKISFLINGNPVTDNEIISTTNEIGKKSFPLEFKNKNIPLALGGVFYVSGENILNTLESYTHFKGYIDEFRMFFKFRSKAIIKKEMRKNIFAQKGLKLYLRFNEPGGNYTNACLNIDYSGNKLHGLHYILNGSTLGILTDTTNYKINSNTPLSLEKLEDSPVLNSAFTEIITKRTALINLAKEYDKANPNLIFNLMPKHYFLSSSEFQNLPVYSNDDVYVSGNQISVNNLTVTSSNLTPSIPANSELVNIVLIWAKFFDKLKLYINSITNFLNVDYDSINKEKIVGMQIPILCKTYGIDFKEILPTITKAKLNKENLQFEDIISEVSIRKIQNILWQRFLINTQDFLRSKGTIKSIQSTFSAFGIDYSKFIDIKEYSFNNTITQDKNFKYEEKKYFSVDFSNRLNLNKIPDFTGITEGYSTNKLYLEINNIQTQSQNGLTDSDWSIEYYFNFNDTINKNKDLNQTKINQDFDSNIKFNDIQYLFVTSTESSSVNSSNLVVKYQRGNGKNTKLGNIIIDIQPISSSTAANQTLTLRNVNIFDFSKHLVITQSRNNNILSYKATISDVGNQISLKSSISASSEKTVANLSTLISNNEYTFKSNNLLNIRVGDFKYNTNNMLNSTISNNSIFEGQVLKIRLWSHKLSDQEISSHSKDIDNIGKKDLKPLDSLIADFKAKIDTSFSVVSGARQWTLRNINSNNSCKIYSKNLTYTNDLVIRSNSVICKNFNIKFDENNSNNKVNIISYESEENKKRTNNFNIFPSQELPIQFEADKTDRISIDMSIVKFINDDISKIVSSINDFTAKISNSTNIYEYQYKSIDEVRNYYFDKFSDSNFINYSSIGNIFKYFDNIMSSILYDIIPSRVRFEGFNYVYESHALERHKYEYKNKDSINTIVDNNNWSKFHFSRDTVLSRRSLSYNFNRRH